MPRRPETPALPPTDEPHRRWSGLLHHSDDALVRETPTIAKMCMSGRPQGTGTCQESKARISSRLEAPASSLISAGSSPFDSGLLSASAPTGPMSSFSPTTHLRPQDHNGPSRRSMTLAKYGGFLSMPQPPPCAASDECHGPGSQAPGPPEVRTNAGSPANYTPPTSCRRGFVAKHGRCVRKPHKPKRRHRRAIHRHHGGGK